MAQDAILKFNTILKAKEVEFPAVPKISPEAKVSKQPIRTHYLGHVTG